MRCAAAALMHAALVLLTTFALGWDWTAGAVVVAGTWAVALPLAGLGWLAGRALR